MHVLLNKRLLSPFLALFSLSSSAPTNTSTDPGINPVHACLLPQIALSTLEQPFTLRASTDAPFSDWPVQIKPPTAQEATELYISNSDTKIRQPVFTLQDGKLTIQGDNGANFAAYFGLTIEIFPPVLQPLFFGGGDSDFSNWIAVYACDAVGHQYLELTAGKELVVDKVAEGQKIKVKPGSFEGSSVTIHLKVQA